MAAATTNSDTASRPEAKVSVGAGLPGTRTWSRRLVPGDHGADQVLSLPDQIDDGRQDVQADQDQEHIHPEGMEVREAVDSTCRRPARRADR